MKTSRYSDSQILSILKQAENGIAVPELCREHGMSSATFYKWRAKYGGTGVSDLSRVGAEPAHQTQKAFGPREAGAAGPA